MQRTHFDTMPCPIARSLERVGEWWSILILREALAGATRFDQFQKQLPIAPNMLTRRLQALVRAGLLERRPYSARPLRHEYVLTGVGRDFRTVLVALMTWGNRHFAPEGASVLLRDSSTGATADPVLVDRHTGLPITSERHRFMPGPLADAHLHSRFVPASASHATSTTGTASAAQRPPSMPNPERRTSGKWTVPRGR